MSRYDKHGKASLWDKLFLIALMVLALGAILQVRELRQNTDAQPPPSDTRPVAADAAIRAAGPV